jgi:hypothetical protein
MEGNCLENNASKHYNEIFVNRRAEELDLLICGDCGDGDKAEE